MGGLRNLAGAILAIGAVASCATGEHAALPRTEGPAPAAFDTALVRRGEALAAIGDCRGCHTREGGKPFAGGLALSTPFGTLYTTNITPDPQTGIGRWSEEAFGRAMREGVDRGGHHLYPAFPYDHYTRVTDDDVHAIYAYLMTRPAVNEREPPNRLMFPFNVRAAIGAWKRLYFRPGPFRPDPARSAEWNRGAYLAEGLGHCGACHTPRNALGAEEADRHFDGGEAEAWHAYAINARSQAPVPWTVDSLVAYLRQGWDKDHGVSRGPMAPVTGELAAVPEADVRAIAVYVASLMAGASREGPHERGDGSYPRGAAIYEGACHACHDGSQPLPFGGIPLALSIGVAGESPRNLVNVVLYGLPAAEGETAPIMPGYGAALDDAQVAELVRYLRQRFTAKPQWEDVERIVREARAAGGEAASPPAGGSGTDPATTGRS